MTLQKFHVCITIDDVKIKFRQKLNVFQCGIPQIETSSNYPSCKLALLYKTAREGVYIKEKEQKFDRL